MSIITAAQWVPRGFAAPAPKKYTLDDSEYERIAELAKLKLNDAAEDLEEAQARDDDDDSQDRMDVETEDVETEDVENQDVETEGCNRNKNNRSVDYDELKEYDLEHYDDNDDDENDGLCSTQEENLQGRSMAMFGNLKSMTYYESNNEDPYITLNAAEEDEEEEEQDLRILATDNLILSAKVEDELAQLEIYVFEDEGDNLYVHHDIMLPAIPLCLEWLDVPVSNSKAADKTASGNYVAVGTMDPEIEIWDLDTVDCMYPNAILGQAEQPDEAQTKKKKKKKKKSKSPKANDNYHVDAVLSLAANRQHRNLLASASADKTVKLWDLTTTRCAKSYVYHTDKVCSLAWHTAEPTVLLSGSYDRTVVAADMRAPAAQAPRWGVESDVESVRWDCHDTNFFFVATEGGTVHYHDIRSAPAKPEATKPVWTLHAHDESVSSFDINPVIPGFMATGSTDRTIKLWNIAPTGPSMIVSRQLNVGKVFATTFAPDTEVAFRLAVAGSAGSMQVWDTSTNPAVRNAFAQRIPASTSSHVHERLIYVNDDDSSSSDEEQQEQQQDGDGDSMDQD